MHVLRPLLRLVDVSTENERDVLRDRCVLRREDVRTRRRRHCVSHVARCVRRPGNVRWYVFIVSGGYHNAVRHAVRGRERGHWLVLGWDVSERRVHVSDTERLRARWKTSDRRLRFRRNGVCELIKCVQALYFLALVLLRRKQYVRHGSVVILRDVRVQRLARISVRCGIRWFILERLRRTGIVRRPELCDAQVHAAATEARTSTQALVRSARAA